MSHSFGTVRIVSIVAGHGEVTAVPKLIARIARDVIPDVRINCPPPIRTSQYGFTGTSRERERCFDQARGRAGSDGGILVLLDSEGEAPCQLGPTLLTQIMPLAGRCPVGLVLAHQEYESWLLAGASDLAGYRSLPQPVPVPADPETIRDAKGWLSNCLPPGQKYSPREHQAELTTKFNMAEARRVGSFDKCYREIARLVRAVSHRPESD